MEPSVLVQLSRVLHVHSEPLAQNSQGSLDLLRFSFVGGIEHAPNHAFIHVQPSRKLGIIDVLVPHGEVEREFRGEPPRHWDHSLASFRL